MVSIRRRIDEAGRPQYYVRWRDASGASRERKIGTLKRDAEAVKRDIERQLALGVLYEAKPGTFGAQLDEYLERKKLRVGRLTIEADHYRSKHLAPLRAIPVDQLKAADVEDVFAEVARRSPNQANRALRLAKEALRDAERRDIRIDRRILELPYAKTTKTRARGLEWSQVLAISAELGDQDRRLVLVAVLTGLRQGELLALRATDVDFKRGVLRVERSWTRGQLGEPKGARRRAVQMTPTVMRLLREQLIARRPTTLDLVFPGAAGGHLDPKNWMRRTWRPALELAGVGRVRFHDLRHTYAALMVASNAHAKTLQEQMGHSSITVTLDRYGHLLEAVAGTAAADLERHIQKLDERPDEEQHGG